MNNENKPLEGEVLDSGITTTIEEYSPTAAALTVLSKQYKDKKYEVSTTAGMKAATAARAEIRGLRVALEKKRKEIKADVLDRGRRIDSEAARITAAFEDLEKPIDDQIKVEEARKEQEKQAKIEAERLRVQELQDNIQKIRELTVFPARKTASEIAEILTFARALVISEAYQELQITAQNARETAIHILELFHADAITREEESARLAAEKIELDRRREEQDERDRFAEEKRIAEQEEKDRLDQEATDKASAEAARIAAIQGNLNILRTRHADAIGKGSQDILSLKALYEGTDIDSRIFQEYTDEALRLKQMGIAILDKIYSGTLSNEEAAAKLKADQDALDAKIRADKDAQDLKDQEERDRQAEADRQKLADAEKQAKEDADRAETAEKERMAAEKKLKLEAAKRGSLEEALREILALTKAELKYDDLLPELLNKIALLCEANLPENDPIVKSAKKVKKDKKEAA